MEYKYKFMLKHDKCKFNNNLTGIKMNCKQNNKFVQGD